MIYSGWHYGGAFRDRTFWQATFAAAAAQIVLNVAGKALLGWNGDVTAVALVQLYSDRQLNFLFAVVWLFHLLTVGFITSRLAPRYAPLSAAFFSTYQALGFVCAGAPLLMHLTAMYLIVSGFLVGGPPVLYALVARLFVRRGCPYPFNANRLRKWSK